MTVIAASPVKTPLTSEMAVIAFSLPAGGDLVKRLANAMAFTNPS
jgi:hypothetical protein